MHEFWKYLPVHEGIARSGESQGLWFSTFIPRVYSGRRKFVVIFRGPVVFSRSPLPVAAECIRAKCIIPTVVRTGSTDDHFVCCGPITKFTRQHMYICQWKILNIFHALVVLIARPFSHHLFFIWTFRDPYNTRNNVFSFLFHLLLCTVGTRFRKLSRLRSSLFFASPKPQDRW